MMQIDLMQIEYFLEVARQLNFTKAAEVLYTSQPAVSRKVAALEAELGIQLIGRSGRQVVLTMAGEEFQKFFSIYLKELRSLQAKFSDIDKYKISFGIFNGWMITGFIEKFINKFHEDYPDLDIFINSGNAENLLNGLRLGKFDFILGIKELFCRETDIVAEDLYKIRKVAVFSRNSSLAAKEKLQFTDFAKYNYYVCQEQKEPLEMLTNKKLFDRYGFSPQLKQMSDIDSVFMAIHAGRGYTILDEYQGIINNRDFNHFVLPESESVTVSLAYSREFRQNSLQMKFMQGLINYLQKNKDTIKNA